jgi:hypothetical protein
MTVSCCLTRGQVDDEWERRKCYTCQVNLVQEEEDSQIFLYNNDCIRKKKHFYNLNCLSQCSVSHVASAATTTTTSIITSGGIYQQTNLHHLPTTVVGATVKHKSKERCIRSVPSMQQMPRVSAERGTTLFIASWEKLQEATFHSSNRYFLTDFPDLKHYDNIRFTSLTHL